MKPARCHDCQRVLKKGFKSRKGSVGVRKAPICKWCHERRWIEFMSEDVANRMINDLPFSLKVLMP